MSLHEVRTLTALGMPGVWDLEVRRGLRPPLPGLGGHEPQRLGRGYETLGNATAETVRADR